ncbi:hypothetical protein PAAG_11698 [Paracoccidioides lutzii Pb01]|uniref:Uncharacterized protein n=1 Tax=Paracoccidioides lutzii (strain ATCC MYA-826 / Pb01) TaxID=502779 RepID=A0A0A2V5E7_PARBA|nr:hypothetical protein PAAG_11698 [Paracoccidioides lutzii Pb01]KGQ01572.1 hypothetical protein PAAG_11698 [Paracoccidioides lutzii Pb01]
MAIVTLTPWAFASKPRAKGQHNLFQRHCGIVSFAPCRQLSKSDHGFCFVDGEKTKFHEASDKQHHQPHSHHRYEKCTARWRNALMYNEKLLKTDNEPTGELKVHIILVRLVRKDLMKAAGDGTTLSYIKSLWLSMVRRSKCGIFNSSLHDSNSHKLYSICTWDDSDPIARLTYASKTR